MNNEYENDSKNDSAPASADAGAQVPALLKDSLPGKLLLLPLPARPFFPAQTMPLVLPENLWFETVERVGKTPHQIERTLGLPSNVLRSGCRVYRFKRLPMSHEVDYELDARHPDGLAFDPATLDEARAQRRQAPAKPRVKVYPPGAAHVHQWKLLVDLPVAPVLDLLPGERYPYLH